MSPKKRPLRIFMIYRMILLIPKLVVYPRPLKKKLAYIKKVKYLQNCF